MAMKAGSINFVTDPEAHDQGGRVDEPAPFRILILANFSGRSAASDAWKSAKPTNVDRDNFEDVLARIHPRLTLETGTEDGPIHLSFREIDDFHPDKIHAEVPLFDKLREARGKLAATVKVDEPPPPAAGGNVLDMILGATRTEESQGRRPTSPIEAFFQEVSQAHAVRSDDAETSALKSGVDAALGRFMSSILHDPRFQSLEATWRSLDRLVRRLDTDRTLTISIIDVTKEELAADFASSGGLKHSALHRQVVEPTVGTPGGKPYAVIVADYVFEPTVADVVLLGSLGVLAQAAGAPVLSGASPKIVGCDDLAETPDPRRWKRDTNDDGVASYDALRTLPIAKWIGLTLPRVLTRLPYSSMDRPIESFTYEELDGRGRHSDFLWGNPSYHLAELLALSFRDDEWEMEAGGRTELLDLPVHVDRTGEDPETLPCAEVVLTQAAVESILEFGPMVMLSYRGRDVVRLARFQSIAAPNAPLEGRWK